MLMWLRRQERRPAHGIKDVHPAWIVAFVVLVSALVPFALWIEAHDPTAQAARRAPQYYGQYRHSVVILMAMLGAATAALLIRSYTHFGYMIRYAVIWLVVVGLFMVGYYYRYDLQQWFSAQCPPQEVVASANTTTGPRNAGQAYNRSLPFDVLGRLQRNYMPDPSGEGARLLCHPQGQEHQGA